jgi:hypothetical protein
MLETSNTDRTANAHELTKAVRTILRNAPEYEVQVLATLLSKMRQVPAGPKRRASDKLGAGRP